MPKEIETKFKILSINSFRKSPKKIGAEFISKELEKDTYYTSPSCNFHFGTIRLRSIDNKGIFTVKRPLRRRGSRIYKVRGELEVNIDDVKTFSNMLRGLGFLPCFISKTLSITCHTIQ